jgi:hypothetical protein
MDQWNVAHAGDDEPSQIDIRNTATAWHIAVSRKSLAKVVRAVGRPAKSDLDDLLDGGTGRRIKQEHHGSQALLSRPCRGTNNQSENGHGILDDPRCHAGRHPHTTSADA